MLNKIAQILRLQDAVNNYSKVENGIKKLISKTFMIIMIGTLLITALIIYFSIYTFLGMRATYIGLPILLIWIFGGIIYYAMLRDISAGCKDGQHATMIIPALKILFIIIIITASFGLNTILGIIITLLIIFYWYKKIKSWIKEDSKSNNNTK